MAKINKFEEMLAASTDASTGVVDYVKFERLCAEYFTSVSGLNNAEKKEDAIVNEYGKFLKSNSDQAATDASMGAYALTMVGVEPGLTPSELTSMAENHLKNLEAADKAGYIDASARKQISAVVNKYTGDIVAGRKTLPDAALRQDNARLTAENAAQAQEIAGLQAEIARTKTGYEARIKAEKDVADVASERAEAAERRTKELEAQVSSAASVIGQQRETIEKKDKKIKGKNITTAVMTAALVTAIGLGVGHGIASHVQDKKDDAAREEAHAQEIENLKNIHLQELLGVENAYKAEINGYLQTISNLENSIKDSSGDLAALQDIINTLKDDNAALQIALNNTLSGETIVNIFSGILTEEELAAVKNEDGTVNLDALLGADESGVLHDIAKNYLKNEQSVIAYEGAMSAVISSLGMTKEDENGNKVPVTIDDYRDENGAVDIEKLDEETEAFITNQVEVIQGLINTIDANPVSSYYMTEDQKEAYDSCYTLAGKVQELGTALGRFIDKYEAVIEKNDELIAEIDDLEDAIDAKEEELAGKDAIIADKDEIIAGKDSVIADKDQQISDLEDELQAEKDKNVAGNNGATTGDQNGSGTNTGSSNVGSEEENEEDRLAGGVNGGKPGSGENTGGELGRG